MWPSFQPSLLQDPETQSRTEDLVEQQSQKESRLIDLCCSHFRGPTQRKKFQRVNFKRDRRDIEGTCFESSAGTLRAGVRPTLNDELNVANYRNKTPNDSFLSTGEQFPTEACERGSPSQKENKSWDWNSNYSPSQPLSPQPWLTDRAPAKPSGKDLRTYRTKLESQACV